MFEVCVPAEESEEDRQKARNKERAILEFFGAMREEGITTLTIYCFRATL